tara:strand:+ start:219 stop:542 length:324 start_codon:yes stop_codon:yes gene_type:complete
MPEGIGTYGRKVGRPAKKKKGPLKKKRIFTKGSFTLSKGKKAKVIEEIKRLKAKKKAAKKKAANFTLSKGKKAKVTEEIKGLKAKAAKRLPDKKSLKKSLLKRRRSR